MGSMVDMGRFHTDFGPSMSYRQRYGKSKNPLMSKSTPSAKTGSLSLAEHFKRIANGRSIDRLRVEMKEAGYDIGQGTLQRLSKGDTGVRMDSIKKLASFAGMQPDELLRGEEETGEFVFIRRADVKFSNGYGQVVYSEEDRPPLSFRADFLRKLGIPPGKAVVVDAEGESNYPKILPGAVVLINSADTENLNGDFFAFRVEGELLIKRLSKLEGAGIIATAENSDFKPKNVVYSNPEDFEVIGRAVWTGVEL